MSELPETLHTSEEICEALVRHVEVSGSEVFEKNFRRGKDGKVLCSVWCIVGNNAEDFARACRAWLDEHGFSLD